MASPTLPDWLKLRDGSMTPGISSHIVFVNISGRPEYKLEARPSSGQYSCSIISTMNGKLLDDSKPLYANLDAALSGGLERLRDFLGW